MSVRIDGVAAAQAVTRAAYDSSRARTSSNTTSPSTSAAEAAGREAELKRQLEERLNTDIARIRRRVDTHTTDANATKTVGRTLDIRA